MSVDVEEHGFLLGYEKASQISGNKKPFAKSACVFFRFCHIRDCEIAEVAVPVFIKPASWRVFFFYVIEFPSSICEPRNGRTPESDGPFKKSVVRIAGQQARPGE
ncbi:MAG: hypothetical protein WCC21_12635 [Candidatus Acidiferrales bacterium]